MILLKDGNPEEMAVLESLQGLMLFSPGGFLPYYL